MTRKHFQLIADVIRGLRLEWIDDKYDRAQQRNRIAHEFAAALASQNPAFNKARFIDACDDDPDAMKRK